MAVSSLLPTLRLGLGSQCAGMAAGVCHNVAVTEANIATLRVLSVLRCFFGSAETHSVSEISAELGMTKSMVSRALGTLSRHGFVMRDPQGVRYQLGIAAFLFGPVRVRCEDIQALCRPTIRALHDLTSEAVSLLVPVGGRIVCVDSLTGYGDVARNEPLGYSTPLHAAAMGLAALAHFPEEERAAYLGRRLLAVTERTITSPEAIRAAMEVIREDGYARSRGDLTPAEFVRGCSFPILDIENQPHCVVNISGPTERFENVVMGDLFPQVCDLIMQLRARARLYWSSRDPVPLNEL